MWTPLVAAQAHNFTLGRGRDRRELGLVLEVKGLNALGRGDRCDT
jgi:hypothetical protein